ncbi:MAG: hypothetical protein LWW90_09850, partial [Candidatus Desulfofervidus auxilii]|nr:hypothetical protein [Candidatus Desulfofervidus auxilii]
TLGRCVEERAYNSLNKHKKVDYGVRLEELNPLLFYLNDNELDQIESVLPPFSSIAAYIFNNKIKLKREEIKILKEKIGLSALLTKKGKKLKKMKKEILSKVIPEKYAKLQKEYEKQIWYNFRKIIIIFYIEGMLATYMKAHNVYSLILWILGVLPYYGLKLLSLRISNQKISLKLSQAASLYFLARYGPGAAQSLIEFGLLSPYTEKILNGKNQQFWKYTPKPIRKILFTAGELLSGNKRKKFDEKEIRDELYILPETVKNNVPGNVRERFKERVVNCEIELEDVRKTLPFYYISGYYKRSPVIENGRIVDREYVRKLAAREGVFSGRFEEKILKRPWKYLGCDLDLNGKIVWVKDVIGIASTKIDGLQEGIIRKEGYLALLGTKADEIARRFMEEREIKSWKFENRKLQYFQARNKRESPKNLGRISNRVIHLWFLAE